MSDDPLASKPAGAWVTAAPSHNRALDVLAEPAADGRPGAVPRSAHWGLTALMLGVPLVAAAPVTVLLSRDLWTRGPQSMHVPLAFVGALIAGVLILALAITGVIFGVRGWLLALAERQPIALGLGGAMLCGAALLIWLGIFGDLMAFFFQHLR
jgi:hypothetical protein